jgi:hypothetical protein
MLEEAVRPTKHLGRRGIMTGMLPSENAAPPEILRAFITHSRMTPEDDAAPPEILQPLIVASRMTKRKVASRMTRGNALPHPRSFGHSSWPPR